MSGRVRARQVARAAVAVGAATVLLAGVAAGATQARIAPRLHVAILVPSVLVSNGRQVWVANTGSASVLELNATSGGEVMKVSGDQYRLNNSDGIFQYGNAVWVANAASNSVTEINATNGHLVHTLGGPTFHFAVPLAVVAADRHVFVLAQAGDKVTELSSRSARLVRYLKSSSHRFAHVTAMVPVGTHLWLVDSGADGGLTQLSAATGGVSRVVSTRAGHFVDPVAIATDGSHLWVVNKKADRLSELSASTGAFVRSVVAPKVELVGVTSIAVAKGVVWVARAGEHHSILGGFNAQTGRLVRAFGHRFSYPTVFADGRHVWVVDRIQSNVTELNARSGAVIRVVSR